MKLIDILIQRRKNYEKYFKNYSFWAKKIKKVANEILGDSQVFIFGSVLKKGAGEVPRDIDILIISPNAESGEKRIRKKIKILKKAVGSDSPFQLHLITPKEYKEWYQFFLKEKIEI